MSVSWHYNPVAGARKRSKWVFCGRHASWFEGERRYRIAETMVEGGPWMGEDAKGCADGLCRLWPGMDFYSPQYCHGELELDWTSA